MPNSVESARRRGRRPGTGNTRQAVLDAARKRFAEDGYAGATIRRIASDAEVDPSMVLQFFRSKQELFAAVMSITPDALSRFANSFAAPTRLLGETVTRAFLEVWDEGQPDSRPLLAMLRGAIANESAVGQLREFIEARLLEETRPESHDDPSARARVGVASSLLVGMIVGRQIVKVPTLVAMSRDQLVEMVAPAVQAVLTGPAGAADAPR